MTEANVIKKLENEYEDHNVNSQVQSNELNNITAECIIKEEPSNIASLIHQNAVTCVMHNNRNENSCADTYSLNYDKKRKDVSSKIGTTNLTVPTIKLELNEISYSDNPASVFNVSIKEEEPAVEYYDDESKDPLATSEINVDASQHESTHENAKSAIGDLTNIGSNSSSDFTMHRGIQHDKKCTYACDVCNKTFSSRSRVKRHKRIHTGERPYVCQVCNKGFTETTHLVRHRRIHTGERPFVCDVCHKGFTENGHLVTHKRIHTGERPYQCEMCDKRFIVSSDLVKHKRIHTGERPYVCEVCNKGFTENSAFVRHKRKHTGEKPHFCDICNKAFTYKMDLKEHKLLHTGEKPHVCSVCDKGFLRKYRLIRHEITHIDKSKSTSFKLS